MHLTLSIALSSIPISGERRRRVAYICCVLLVDKDKLSLEAVTTKEEVFKRTKDAVVYCLNDSSLLKLSLAITRKAVNEHITESIKNQSSIKRAMEPIAFEKNSEKQVH